MERGWVMTTTGIYSFATRVNDSVGQVVSRKVTRGKLWSITLLMTCGSFSNMGELARKKLQLNAEKNGFGETKHELSRLIWRRQLFRHLRLDTRINNCNVMQCKWYYLSAESYDRIMQLNWLYFCGICQLIPLKLWSNTAQGCNHQWTACPSYSFYVQLLWYPMYYPGGIKARVSPVQWSKPHSILVPTQDSNPGGRIQNHKRWPPHYHWLTAHIVDESVESTLWGRP